MRHFGKRYRAVAYNARGFPPSDVPEQPSSYSQARAADDILAVLEAIGEGPGPRRRPLDGRLRHPPLRPAPPSRWALSLCVGGCGYGAELDKRDAFRAEADVVADRPPHLGHAGLRRPLCLRADARAVPEQGPARASPSSGSMLSEHSAVGSANTQLGVQKERPSLYHLVEEMKGDRRSDPRHHRRRGLALPASGHPDEADHPVGRPRRHPEQRPRHQHRGARRVQPDRRGLPRPGGERTLAPARSPRGQRINRRASATSSSARRSCRGRSR